MHLVIIVVVHTTPIDIAAPGVEGERALSERAARPGPRVCDAYTCILLLLLVLSL